MKKIQITLFFVLVTFFLKANGQVYHLDLYKGQIPNSRPTSVTEKLEKGDYNKITLVSNPDISVYLPTKKYATGQAVIICPGGGYIQLSVDLEGSDIAGYLNSIGVAAIILKYRLPSDKSNIEPDKAPLMDAQRAMRLVRYNASKWNIDSHKIGIMGFSAGGHLASTLGTHFDYGNKTSADSVERQSCRPDFMILGYPVISFTDSVKRSNSRKVLIGESPDKNLILYYSNEFHVNDDTPPTFFVHADNDPSVSVEQTLLMYKALRQKNIPAEVHILSEGGHGFGLATNNEHVASWTNSMKLWLKTLNK
jgi:acetyl esterase/lipase